MLAFLNTPTFPVFSPPTYFNPAFILRFYLSFIFYLAFIYCVLLFTNIIYHVMRTDTCNKPHTLRDAVTGRNRIPLPVPVPLHWAVTGTAVTCESETESESDCTSCFTIITIIIYDTILTVTTKLGARN